MITTKETIVRDARDYYEGIYGPIDSATTEKELMIRSALFSFARYVSQYFEKDYATPDGKTLHQYVKKMPYLPPDWFKHCAPVIVNFINPYERFVHDDEE